MAFVDFDQVEDQVELYVVLREDEFGVALELLVSQPNLP